MKRPEPQNLSFESGYVAISFHLWRSTYNREENFANESLLSVDNAPGHPPDLSDTHPNIKVHLLLQYTSSLIQSIEQGIIAIFKSYYLREILTLMAAATDEREYDARSFWKDFNLKLAATIFRY